MEFVWKPQNVLPKILSGVVLLVNHVILPVEHVPLVLPNVHLAKELLCFTTNNVLLWLTKSLMSISTTLFLLAQKDVEFVPTDTVVMNVMLDLV
jgi:hypothetical protein